MKNIRNTAFILLLGLPAMVACKKKDCGCESTEPTGWIRNPENPILRDTVAGGGYEVAGDATVFSDTQGMVRMVYTGDVAGHASIKLATKDAFLNRWHKESSLLASPGPSGIDSEKETPFYRKDARGKHQIYYIGYESDTTYYAQLFLAEADNPDGPYTQMENPIVPRGNIAGKDVYCITSPSVLALNDTLFLAFLAWNNHPDLADTVWVMGGESIDHGHTWSNLREVDVPIGMEGQITPAPDGGFVAVYTGEYQSREAIFYAESARPLDGWIRTENPILIQNDSKWEIDEIIAPQIYFETGTNRQHLFYTGADHDKGWWIMEATMP